MVYNRLTKEYQEILESYQYSYKASDYDSSIIDNHSLDSIAILIMSIHEFITHIDEPGYFGFNYIEPNNSVARVHKNNLKLLVKGMLSL